MAGATSKKKSKKLKIGSILVSEGYLTKSQLKEVLSQQKRTKHYLPLGLLCVQSGLLSKTELSLLLKTHKYKLYLGELLVNMSLITPSHLRQALKEQKKTGKKFGQLLIAMGLISEAQLVHGLSIQLGIPKIIPDINLIDRSLAQKVSEAFLRRVEAVPAFKEAETLTVIMANPLSASTISDFKRFFKSDIQPAVGTRAAIHELLDSLFHRIQFTDASSTASAVLTKDLVTGPTGSGKTTTLYASLNYLNKQEQKIITVEDPVEYTIDGIVQGKLEPKLNLTYEDFLRAMMRQDPDVIMVGEIRDRVAAEATIQSALTGHKVFSTFHTDDTTGALLKLMDMGVETFLISSTVVSVLSQRLIRTLCPHCKEPCWPDKGLLEAFDIKEIDPSKFSFHRATGCVQCNHAGYKGRTAIQELLVVTDDIRNAILSRRPSREIRTIARDSTQMISMREDGLYKATKGITSMEEVMRVVYLNDADLDAPRTIDEIVALIEEGGKEADHVLSDYRSKMTPTNRLTAERGYAN